MVNIIRLTQQEAATVNTAQRRGLKINMNKFLEWVRDYIIERREGP